MNKKYTIAFLGTDGSGKSTIIQAITPKVQHLFKLPVYYEHLRPNYIPSLGVALGKRTKESECCIDSVMNPHAMPPSGFFGSLFRLSYYMIDYTWGYFRKIYRSHAVWFFDRYFYDYLIDPKRGRISLPPWIIKFYECFVPSPDLIICLGTEPEIIYKRKPETSLEEVKRQIEQLHLFCQSHHKAIWLDTGTTINVSVEKVMEIITTFKTKKNTAGNHF